MILSYSARADKVYEEAEIYISLPVDVLNKIEEINRETIDQLKDRYHMSEGEVFFRVTFSAKCFGHDLTGSFDYSLPEQDYGNLVFYASIYDKIAGRHYFVDDDNYTVKDGSHIVFESENGDGPVLTLVVFRGVTGAALKTYLCRRGVSAVSQTIDVIRPR